jgi:hypothetical protein
MPRLIIRQGETRHLVARVEISKNDGSINLSFVRKGQSRFGWISKPNISEPEMIEFSDPQPKSKRISIHTSGRVNYQEHPDQQVNFIPNLFDLKMAEIIVCYVVPSAVELDTVREVREDDVVLELQHEIDTTLGFEFFAIPRDLEFIPAEVWRVIIEGQYGLACTLVLGASLIPNGMPPAAFVRLRPAPRLASQEITEEVAYLRFQKLRHENHIKKQLEQVSIPEENRAQIVEEVVRNGQGIRGPNQEGIWEIVCNVSMRIRPSLDVQFADSRYMAELVDLKPNDRRLEKVRVRFRVYDQTERSWIKHAVEIIQASLSAEL